MLFKVLNKNVICKRLFLFLLLVVFTSILYFSLFGQHKSAVCFFTNNPTDQKTLVNLLESKIKPSNGRNVFFHETSCSLDNVIKLSARQACAIESAAKANPSHQIFVLFASPVGFRNATPLPLVDSILSYNNVHLNYLNITQYAEKTPLEEWIKNGDLFRSTYINSHTSDVLRYLTLWKYGGTYLDLDVVVRKPLDSIPSNYAGAESPFFVAVGIINLDQSFGHQLAHMCLKDLRENFDGTDWGNNGPGVLTRVLKEICETSVVKNMNKSKCYGFSVLPIEDCYSIPWVEHQKFFKEQYLNEAMARLNDSLIAHVWNKHSETTPLLSTSNVAYIQLAKEFCPNVLESVAKSGDFF